MVYYLMLVLISCIEAAIVEEVAFGIMGCLCFLAYLYVYIIYVYIIYVYYIVYYL
jgi:hypothetical protein